MSHVLELPELKLPPLPDLWRTVPAASPGPHMAPAEPVEAIDPVEPIEVVPVERPRIDFPRPMLGAGRSRAGLGDAA